MKPIIPAVSILVAVTGANAADIHGLAPGPGQGGRWSAPCDLAVRPNPVPPSEESVTRGRELYGAHCARCHGEGGGGDGPDSAALPQRPASLVRAGVQQSEGELAWKIATGRNSMPGWGGQFDESQIWDIVNYLRRL